jgi:hypothetical protein
MLDVKSTGTLVDELYTTDLKIEAGTIDAQERRHTLANLVTGRMVVMLDDMPKYREFQHVMKQLQLIVKRCWDAQEIIMSLPEIDKCTYDQVYTMATAAKEAQQTNGQRNKLIRELDTLIGEASRSQLEKTYT